MNLHLLDKKALNKLSVALFLLVALFFPRSDAYFRFYFVAVLFSAVVLLGSRKKMYIDWLSLTGIGVLVISIASIFIRFGFIVSPNLRDYTEFGRLLLPVVLLIFRDKFKDVGIGTVFPIFAFYAGLDCLVSVLDFAGISFFGLVDFTNSLYVTGYHAAKEYRIDGLSAGPGQHGITMLIFFTFFYIRAFQSKRLVLPLSLSIVSAIPLFLSQSRTAIISLALVSFAVPLMLQWKGNRQLRRRSLPILSIVVVVAGYLLSQFLVYFSRIMELLAGLEAVHSIEARMTRYSTLFESALEYPFFFLVGFGKDFFEIPAFDNEYIFMFLVHGPIIASVIVGGVLIFIGRTVMLKRIYQCPYRTILFFLLAIGLIVAYPASFFLQLSNIPLILLFVNMAFWEDRRLKRAKSTA